MKLQSLKSYQLVLPVVALIVVLASVSALAQGNGAVSVDKFSGRYEGTAKSADGSFLNVIFDLKSDGGKVSGTVSSGATTIKIIDGTLADSKLTLKLEGHTGQLTAKVDGEKITGEWVEGSSKRTVEVKKAAAANTAAATPNDAPVNLTGDWEAVADAQGQPFPFSLVLKVDGDKVTGTSTSQLGESTITNGVWKDGHLNFVLESPNGTVTMSATVIEGKLSGEFDFAGQVQGKWVAVKKK
ncbi:MAG: hypothetical protein C5B55_05380 [Blastocatellia bacterium]|nr:MAG: hypothetical protein C5B55_05380 [Blastocatellia bacterium]